MLEFDIDGTLASYGRSKSILRFVIIIAAFIVKLTFVRRKINAV